MINADTNPAPATTHRGPSRRQALTGLAAVGSLAALAACAPGSSGGSSSSGDGGGTLRVSTWGNDSRLKLTQQAVAEFEKANPDIKVTIENSEWTSYWDKLATGTAANDSPDVIQMDELYIAAYGTRGALLDLETVSAQLDLSEMDEKMRDTGLVDGTFDGAPIGTGNLPAAPSFSSRPATPSIPAVGGLTAPWAWIPVSSRNPVAKSSPATNCSSRARSRSRAASTFTPATPAPRSPASSTSWATSRTS